MHSFVIILYDLRCLARVAWTPSLYHYMLIQWLCLFRLGNNYLRWMPPRCLQVVSQLPPPSKQSFSCLQMPARRPHDLLFHDSSSTIPPPSLHFRDSPSKITSCTKTVWGLALVSRFAIFMVDVNGFIAQWRDGITQQPVAFTDFNLYHTNEYVIIAVLSPSINVDTSQIWPYVCVCAYAG